jgi:cytochrome bd-type quinol oxidase subunit 2
MTTELLVDPVLRDVRPTSRRLTPSLFIGAGLLLAAGGQLHPRGSGDTVEGHLLSMFASPTWPLAHLLLLAGMVSAVAAYVLAWRTQALGARAQRWLPVVIAGWAFGALEVVPHLLAAGEAHALEHHEATPVLDVHLVMQVIATPAVGLSGALVALLVHLAARNRVTLVLAVFGILGGLLSAAAGPLVVATGDPRFTVLFPFQAGLAVWLLGTGIRLLRR